MSGRNTHTHTHANKALCSCLCMCMCVCCDVGHRQHKGCTINWLQFQLRTTKLRQAPTATLTATPFSRLSDSCSKLNCIWIWQRVRAQHSIKTLHTCTDMHMCVCLFVCLFVCMMHCTCRQGICMISRSVATHTHTHTNNNTNRNAIAAWSLDEKWIKKKNRALLCICRTIEFRTHCANFRCTHKYTYCFLRFRFAVVGKYSILTPLVSAILKKQKLNDEQNMLLMNWNELEPTHTLKADSVTRQAFR